MPSWREIYLVCYVWVSGFSGDLGLDKIFDDCGLPKEKAGERPRAKALGYQPPVFAGFSQG